jgi:hypothetical protein
MPARGRHTERARVGECSMLEQWLSTGNWTKEQWLIASILAFVVVATLVMIWRIYTIYKMASTRRERPNLRVARRLRR